MLIEPRAFDCLFDERDIGVMSEAFAIACDALDANGSGERAKALRTEIAAALVEAATYGIGDKEAMAKAAIDLVYIDLIETDFA